MASTLSVLITQCAYRHTAFKVQIKHVCPSTVATCVRVYTFEMPAKRGRPLSRESDDVAISYRRRQVRERVRRLRQRQSETQIQPPPVTEAQQRQCENIINLPSVAEEEAFATLPSLGLRKSSDLEIPDDPLDAQLQETALDIYEHESLYRNSRQPKISNDKRLPSSAAGFFREFAKPRAY